jgi:hypothetical protein
LHFVAELINKKMENEIQWPNEQRRLELAGREPFFYGYDLLTELWSKSIGQRT